MNSFENNPNNRNDVMNDLQELTHAWDGSAIHATEILESSYELFEQLKATDSTDSEVEETFWLTLIQIHLKMQKSMKEEQNKLMGQLEQLSKSEKVMSHYIQDKQPSIFVDKDF